MYIVSLKNYVLHAPSEIEVKQGQCITLKLIEFPYLFKMLLVIVLLQREGHIFDYYYSYTYNEQ